MITDETIDLTILELARTMRALKALKAARKKPGQTWGGPPTRRPRSRSTPPPSAHPWT